MACLLPQFKCPQDTLSTHLKTHSNNNNNSNSNLLKTREPPVSRAVCVMSMTLAMATTTTSTMVDVENLQLHELEAHSNSIRPLTSIGSMDLPQKSNFEATLATETLLTGEEATIAAAAAEAVALAKAAVEIAHDVTLMIKNNPSMRSDSMSSERTTETDFIQFKRVQLSKMDQASISGTETSSDGRSEKFSLLGFDEMETADDGPKLPQPHLSSSIEVWSRRQRERIARRGRPTAKAASTVVSVKSESTRRKKRTASQDLDFSDPLHYLKATAGTSRLLTATEETKLSEGIQDMLKLQKLREEVSKRCEGPLTFAQWATAAGIDQKTLRRRLNYGQLCKEKMVKSNIRLVISIAKNYQGAGMNLQDLVQEGCRGLVKGTERFDASKGFKFSTYAHWWIRQAVRKSLSERARTIRLPFHMVEATYRVKEAKKQLYSDTGKHPSNEEVAAATGLSMKRLMAVLLTPKAPISLDQKFGFMDLKPSEVTADPNAETSEDLMMRQFMKQDLKKVLDSLSPRESQVVRMRFGLEDGRMRTLHEIGELIGVSRERIRQIESCAFRKLKHTKRSKNLQQYLIP